MASLPISDCPPQPSLEEVFLQGGTLTDDGAKPHQYPLVGLPVRAAAPSRGVGKHLGAGLYRKWGRYRP